MNSLPNPVRAALTRLEQSGFEAYLVGGCVRDLLLGRVPTDYDITTNALPDQICQAFSGEKTILTGKKHGTVTVVLEQMPLEITTYRVDGSYSDGRHPDEVRFTSCLRDDLARRDFTVNAMAFHPETGLVDPFGGQRDLEEKILRCVGNPETRFEEDALRILRAVRFSSTLGFSVEERTRQALFTRRGLLVHVSRERVRDELNKMLCGEEIQRVLLEFQDIIAEIIPEIIPCIGFSQHSIYHMYSVWEHTVHTVSGAPPELIYRLTMLLHDLAKPHCLSIEHGTGHFYGHQARGAEIAEQILKRLKYSSAITKRVVLLIRYHSLNFEESPKKLKVWLNRIGEEALRQLLEIQRCDIRGKDPSYWYEIRDLDQLEQKLDVILQEGQCYSIPQLGVDGDDLRRAGITQGRMIGKTLEHLLDCVIEERLPNESSALLREAQTFFAAKQDRSNGE